MFQEPVLHQSSSIVAMGEMPARGNPVSLSAKSRTDAAKSSEIGFVQRRPVCFTSFGRSGKNFSANAHGPQPSVFDTSVLHFPLLPHPLVYPLVAAVVADVVATFSTSLRGTQPLGGLLLVGHDEVLGQAFHGALLEVVREWPSVLPQLRMGLSSGACAATPPPGQGPVGCWWLSAWLPLNERPVENPKREEAGML